MSMSWDAGARRESRIPRAPGPGHEKPLTEKQNTMDRKRRGAPLEAVPEAKRQGRGKLPAASAATAAAAAPAAEETFQDIHDRTGMTVEDILNRKLTFKKGTLPQKKLEEMGPVIKELKAVGWHLLSSNERAEMDAKQWKQHAEEVEVNMQTKEVEFQTKSSDMNQRLDELKGQLGQAEAASQQLKQDLTAAAQQLASKEDELAKLQQQLQERQEQVEKLEAKIAEKETKITEMEDVVRQSQKYSATLQSYNTSLQSDVQAEKVKREELARHREELQGQVAELGGMTKSLERLLQLEQEQCEKLRAERETAARDVAVLRIDLDNTRADKERLIVELKDAKDELERYKDAGGKSMQTLEAMENSKATLEAQLASQRSLLDGLRRDLGAAREGQAMAESLAGSRGTELEELKAQLSTLQGSLADAERRVYESELIRRKLHNTIQELKGNIRVFCRVRPPSSAEMADTASTAIATEFPTTGELLGRGVDITVPGSLTGQAPLKHTFAFDKVFAPTADQASVFEEISELVQSALDGHKVCIFAYGQTGSGKTYTMLGNAENRGIIPRAMQQIFESSRVLATQGWQFSMQASMLEIYNEDYKDLLTKKKLPEGKQHKVVHDQSGHTMVSDLTLLDVNTPADVEALLDRAMEKRSVGCTALNEQSSRSHAVFTLRIEGTNTSSQLKVSGVLNLIDLAGSERVKESGATGVRLKEAQSINKSLSALGDVIMALANKAEHIPYRNSKLTWLLQPSLGGDAKTLMFVNISPSPDFAPESLCSLRFAAKVNACEIGVARRNIKTG